MYESYTRQSLPPESYRELLGTALCVFNSNNAFVIENFLNEPVKDTWYQLIDKMSGKLLGHVENQFKKRGAKRVLELFDELIEKRNRIIHSFQITDSNGQQTLATKEKKTNKQFQITEEYLFDFIKTNEKLSDELHNLRGN